MSVALFLKNNLRNIPPRTGRFLNRLPYSKRPGIGKIYTLRQKEIIESEVWSDEERRGFVFVRIRNLVDYSYRHIKFYKEYYDKQGFHPSLLNSFDDLIKIPIINKAILKEYNIEDRSSKRSGRYIVNTGGSSGTPFDFYIEPSSMGHEWAHMHSIWGKFNFKPSDFKLVFGGRSNIKDLVDYDVLRNSFALDLYADYEKVAKKLKKLLGRYDIKYLHGYPSSIYDFVLYCKKEEPELLNLLSENLEGAFLGSEFPYEKYRKEIEESLKIGTVSWYGHTERAVLAYEKGEPFEYFPFLTYGFSEAIPQPNGNYNLISTSYYNFASPFIRYDTEDEIESPIVTNGVLNSFKILKGRSGQCVIDRDGRKINLTGLIFGRHHELFNYSDFIQVRQLEKGKIEILFVSKSKLNNPRMLFDMDNLNFNISFKQIEEPVRTNSGKINLLINKPSR